MALVRWKLTDPDGELDDWTFPINPNKMDAPELANTVTTNMFGLWFTFQDTSAPPVPADWTFQGVLWTLADFDLLQAYLDNGRPVVLHDHFGRTFRILLQGVDTTRAGTRRMPERHKYTVRTLMLKRLS